MSDTLRIAIIGGGIGGLTLAVALGKLSQSSPNSPNVKVDLYESTPKFTTVGAGISMYTRTWRAMQLLGLDGDVAKVAVQPPDEEETEGTFYRKSDQLADGYNFYEMKMPFGAITLHRADIVSILHSNLPSICTTHFNKKLSSYSSSPKSNFTELRFTDGTTTTTDVLIGADGIHSAVRSGMFSGGEKEFAEPVWSGTIAYRYLIPAKKLEEAFPGHQGLTKQMAYLGKNKHAVCYPISQGTQANVVLFVSQPHLEGTHYEPAWVSEVEKDFVGKEFVGWEKEVQALLDCAPQRIMKWAICVVNPLPKYVEGRVGLLGDAAHAMTPHFGAGAGQAVEDAYILSRLLTHPLLSSAPSSDIHRNLEIALKIYETVRRPVAQAITKGARDAGLLYEFNLPLDVPEVGTEVQDGEDGGGMKVMLGAIAKKIYELEEWQFKGPDVDEDWVRAKRMLADHLGLDTGLGSGGEGGE
ncbi:hypothetical protein JAAARDRAFT_33536 [Jaapia argillacea MUCL 33604]|uniref:FAD-binding domain-containing protein n=1 Tax=Jaapia argillacea MUCL 33604 TaxID=933084 RepID=A0A067Q8Y3_9AGAM|nr:hypothetical protein JAAARDRAFT_33536 [Jaapia argillacea MUCL 33604]